MREKIRQQRQQLSSSIQLQAALEISQCITHTLWFRRAQRMAFYQAVHGEVDPGFLMQDALKMHKTCYLPVCDPINHQKLFFAPYFPNDSLIKNRYGILEPDLRKRDFCQLFTLDIVFMPLVAFDKQGNRLGSGCGYYDKTFAFVKQFSQRPKPLLVGLAYDFQEVKKLEPKSWDVPMDKIIIVKT